MRRAMDLARRHHPHPNPRVGSVVVSSGGAVLGEGSHVAPGSDHAEVVALKRAGTATRGSTLYVTLEPCVHHGRTPPCVEAIVDAGVARVVIGSRDPDSHVDGRGVSHLREAGIAVHEGVLIDDARALDPGYFHHRETGMPLVTLKYAMTMDGSVAARDRSSRWITSEEARDDAHRLRARADAVVIGAGTLRADDPRLDVRLDGFQGRQPRPVVVAGSSELPPDARLWGRDPVVVGATERTPPSGELVVVRGSKEGLPDPTWTCRALADRGYLDVMLEGGPTLAGSWWKAGVISRGVAYIGAKLAGGLGIPPISGVFETVDEAEPVKITGVHNLGSDVRIDFERVERE